MEQFLQEKAFELSLAIGVPVAVSIYIFILQKRADKSINEIIARMDNLLNQQKKIMGSNEQRRINRIAWLNDHVGENLRKLREIFTDLTERLDRYQSGKSDEDLNLVMSSTRLAAMKISHTMALAERDIDVAREYLKSSWLAVKFIEVIPLLAWDLNITADGLRTMTSFEINEFKKAIEERILELDFYIGKIEDEL